MSERANSELFKVTMYRSSSSSGVAWALANSCEVTNKAVNCWFKSKYENQKACHKIMKQVMYSQRKRNALRHQPGVQLVAGDSSDRHQLPHTALGMQS